MDMIRITNAILHVYASGEKEKAGTGTFLLDIEETDQITQVELQIEDLLKLKELIDRSLAYQESLAKDNEVS